MAKMVLLRLDGARGVDYKTSSIYVVVDHISCIEALPDGRCLVRMLNGLAYSCENRVDDILDMIDTGLRKEANEAK